MQRKDIIVFLEQLESKYLVDSWKIDDVYVWPIIKLDLFFAWWNNDNNDYNALLSQKSPAKSKSSKLKAVAVSLINLLLLRIKPAKKTSILFAGASTHRIDFNNEFINRYFEPIIEELKANKREYLLVEYTAKLSSKNYRRDANLFFTEGYMPAIKFLSFFKRKKYTIETEGLNNFLRDVNEKIPGIIHVNNYAAKLQARVRELKMYASLFDIILRKYQPSQVIELCYYNRPAYGLTYAAFRRKIVSVDLQHGGLGSTHPGYSNFLKVPAGGYNVLPKIFWTWDEASSKVVSAWSTQQHFHQVVNGGNPWSSYFIKHDQGKYQFPDKRIILYTMQFNMPEDFIIDAVKRTPTEYQWWFRMHPRTLSIKGQLKDFLVQHGIDDKVNVDDATQYPLLRILMNAVIHISGFSGSVIEAAQAGVKTIIISSIGVENYQDYIDSKEAVAFLDESGEGIVETILENETNPSKRNLRTTNDYRNVLDQFLK